MRGMTPDERAELNIHMRPDMERCLPYDEVIARVGELIRQRRLVMLADTGDHVDTEITELGQLALRVCPIVDTSTP